ncbi:hypothetical protein Y032_0013g1944 [Ancylostoma ceylanicum]|uniref:Uncharacterized protein n=1 Tax=Ancylostoma ceylanicum TaxID=53326 RepID=A0A016VBA2_9BILA|nr:hypothetical protein Y032_0013g1944 [Ancylostoma ceylanicum]
MLVTLYCAINAFRILEIHPVFLDLGPFRGITVMATVRYGDSILRQICPFICLRDRALRIVGLDALT